MPKGLKLEELDVGCRGNFCGSHGRGKFCAQNGYNNKNETKVGSEGLVSCKFGWESISVYTNSQKGNGMMRHMELHTAHNASISYLEYISSSLEIRRAISQPTCTLASSLVNQHSIGIVVESLRLKNFSDTFCSPSDSTSPSNAFCAAINFFL